MQVLPAAAAQEGTDGEFAVVQGDRCIPVTPLSGDEPVEELYDWREAETDYSSAGTVDLQRDDTSIVFLYDGPNGTSLVFVHGHYGSEESAGGSVSMTIGGLPEGGEWVVEDDLYDGPSNYDNWNHGATTSEIDWTWRYGRTDGGAFRGLGDAVEVTIDPAFNGDSTFGNQYYDGEVADWQVLSGDLANPDRTSLAMDQRVVIASGGCPTEDSGSTSGSSGDGSTNDETTDGESTSGSSTDGDSGTGESSDGSTSTDEPAGEQEDATDGGSERRRTKHEKKQAKHRRKHEKKQAKHEKKRAKQRKKHLKRELKHGLDELTGDDGDD